ncbi:MAG: hypothetical protein JSS02_31735, partial [Planctomycetes bacterium]|nr:hypothetical protein [Planctomycetota bacterium]
MAHWSYSLCGLATLAMLCAGCAANRPNQSHATLDRRAPSSLKSQADSTRPGRARVSAAPAEMAPGDQTFSSTGTRGAESDVLRTAGTRAGRATPDRDPQLAAVIDQELQDATPDERASYQAAFEGKSPEAIRGILRGRRLARGHELASAPTAVPVGHAASYHLGKSAGTNSSGADPVSAPRATMNDGNPPDGPANPNIRLTSETAGGQAHPETAGVDSAAAGGKAQVASAEALTADVTVQAQLEKLIPLAEADAAACQPGPSEAELQSYIKKHFDLRMLYLMAGQQERALQAIPGIDPVDQEFFQQTLWGLTNYFDASSIPAAADRATQTVAQLQSAVLRLQEKANLELRNVAFCHKI